MLAEEGKHVSVDIDIRQWDCGWTERVTERKKKKVFTMKETRREERRVLKKWGCREGHEKTKELIIEICGNGRRGGFSCCSEGGSRLPLPLNKQRVIVRQVVRLSCSAGSTLIDPPTPPTPQPTACVLHATAHIWSLNGVTDRFCYSRNPSKWKLKGTRATSNQTLF